MSEGNNLKILLVEDDTVTSFFMKKLLERHYAVDHASCGSEALEIIQQNMFDLILMDINLGEESLDGVEVLRKIRQQKKYDPVKVFAVTSYALEGDRERFLEAGFDAYLSKPVDKQKLFEAITKVAPRKHD